MQSSSTSYKHSMGSTDQARVFPNRESMAMLSIKQALMPHHHCSSTLSQLSHIHGISCRVPPHIYSYGDILIYNIYNIHIYV